jgi:Flp pilus assembly protein TadD
VHGLVALRRGATTEAEAAFRTAVDINPRNAEAWHHLGVALDGRGERTEAANAYRRSLQIAPERIEVVQALGQVLLVESALDEAQSLLSRVSGRDPGNSRARFALALIAMQQGRCEAALEEATVTTRLTLSSPRAWSLLGAGRGVVQKHANRGKSDR